MTGRTRDVLSPTHIKEMRASSKTLNGGSSRQEDQYLSELLSYSLDRLRKEPDLLLSEKKQIERKIQNTSVSNFSAFISTAKCLGTVDAELGAVCGHLDVLLQGIPELASACEAFSSNSTEVMDQLTRNKQLAGGQSALLELLEVPQLMDTCVRNGVYDEALDLQAFISRLGLLHPEVPVVKILMSQVAEVGRTMLQQLLSRLRTNVQLPECLRIMGYLRRIAAFSEAELRLQFLQCRDEWMSQLVEEVDSSDSYEYVKHLTDVHRLHMFDAIMQYKAIFFDSPNTASSGQDHAASTSFSVKETAMLYSWVQHRITLYLESLRIHLPQINEGGNLASVLEHCMYCGSSLSRVGLDFQGLLQPLFEDCALQLFAQHLNSAVDAFNTKLESHKWVHMPVQMLARGGRGISSAAVKKEGEGGGDGEESWKESEGGDKDKKGDGAVAEDLSPPYMIMEHLPMAVFTNSVLGAFNELRHCALLSMARPISALLQQSLEHVCATLMHYGHTHSLADNEHQLFKSAARSMHDVVIPYITSCFTRIFPGVGSKLDTTNAASILRQISLEA